VLVHAPGSSLRQHPSPQTPLLDDHGRCGAALPFVSSASGDGCSFRKQWQAWWPRSCRQSRTRVLPTTQFHRWIQCDRDRKVMLSQVAGSCKNMIVIATLTGRGVSFHVAIDFRDALGVMAVAGQVLSTPHAQQRSRQAKVGDTPWRGLPTCMDDL
jgi:hypothetical protein